MGATVERGPTLTGLAGRVVLVTGAGQNIGRAVASAFAGAGAHVAVAVRKNEARAKEVAAEARDRGVDALAVVGDVADPDAVDAIVTRVERELGSIDVLVHCVAIRPWLMLVDTPIEVWRSVIDTNCSSYFYLARRLLPSMTERGFGRLIAMGGPDANLPVPRHGAIAVSKAGLSALTRAVAKEHGSNGVTANLVSPTITETTASEHLNPELLREMLPIPRSGRLDEIAFACLYLASEQGSYVTGQTLRVDGGFEM
jgi:NAD(P)-dependent dehydrogenase (short-subunit alcohol dehydrogenase family)